MAGLVGLLGACTDSGSLPEGVSVAVYQTRSDMPLDKIEIQVRNARADSLTVDRAELQSTRFLGSAAWDEQVEIPPGAAVDLKVQMPSASCVPEPDDLVVLSFRDAGGDPATATVTPGDPLGQLEKFSAKDCFAQAVADTAQIRVRGVRGDDLRIFVDPGAATVSGIGSTILFRPVDGRAVAASPGSAPSTREVTLRTNRCDAHALGEDKQGTYFPVTVTLADGRRGIYTLSVDRVVRGQLYRLYARLCGL